MIPPMQSLSLDGEETAKIRDKILKSREIAFKQNEEEVSKRWTFEEGVGVAYSCVLTTYVM